VKNEEQQHPACRTRAIILAVITMGLLAVSTTASEHLGPYPTPPDALGHAYIEPWGYGEGSRAVFLSPTGALLPQAFVPPTTGWDGWSPGIPPDEIMPEAAWSRPSVPLLLALGQMGSAQGTLPGVLQPSLPWGGVPFSSVPSFARQRLPAVIPTVPVSTPNMVWTGRPPGTAYLPGMPTATFGYQQPARVGALPR